MRVLILVIIFMLCSCSSVPESIEREGGFERGSVMVSLESNNEGAIPSEQTNSDLVISNQVNQSKEDEREAKISFLIGNVLLMGVVVLFAIL